jgi:hypothetical protein
VICQPTHKGRTIAIMARPKQPEPDAWWGPIAGPLPTPRSILAAQHLRLALTCRACLHRTDADLQSLVDAGRGDRPVIGLHWRCSQCSSRKVDAVIMSKRSQVR